MTTKRIAYVTSNDSIAFSLDGGMKVIPKAHFNYARIVAVLDSGDLEAVRPLLTSNLKQSLANSTDGSIKYKDGALWFEGQVIPGPISERAIKLFRDGHDVSPLCNFIRNLLDNPSPVAREELFGFLEACDLPITPDGYFIAYKMVSANFRDLYTNTMDNSPGVTVKMNRAEVDPNKNQTCSVGLHFASLAYTRSGYGSRNRGDRMIALKVNPRDVVSIPTDYNNSKGRACQYLVLKELDWDTQLPLLTAGFSLFDEATATPGDLAEAEGEATGQDVLVLTDSGATVTRASNRLWSEPAVRAAKALLADPNVTLTAASKTTGMSRRLLARIRDGEAYADVN